MRRSQLVVLVLLVVALVLLAASTLTSGANILPKDLPPWFAHLDADEDGQISLAEWRKGNKKLEEFHKLDRNGDGFLTPDEVLKNGKNGIQLQFEKGQATYTGAIDPATDERFQNRLSKILTIKMEAGKTYQIDHKSQAFDAFLYLEDPDGAVVAQDDDSGEGNNARITWRAISTGTYRIIATSAGGFRGGAFSLTVLILHGYGRLPPWFTALDANEDGQVSLDEWRKGGKNPDEFRKYDLNDDGFITPEEALRATKGSTHLKLEKGQASYNGDIETEVGARYQGRRSFKVLTINLEMGKVYRIEQTSRVFVPFLYLENPDGGVIAQTNRLARTTRIVHRATKSGTYRIIATSLPDGKTGPFSLSVEALAGSQGLPAWFKKLDANEDGQISLDEWVAGGKAPEDFRKHDLNGDGLVTAEEVLQTVKKEGHLQLEDGQASYNGDIEESLEERYQNKIAFKVFTINLEKGKTYRIVQISQVYYAYLYLESPDGEVLAQHNSGGVSLPARIIHRAAKAGTYRIIATSLGGFRTGPCSLSVQIQNGPRGLPAWFTALDTDKDGQITRDEWRAGGKAAEDFRRYDLNDDGVITAAEVLQMVKQESQLQLEGGQANYTGDIEEAEETYLNKISYKIFTIKLAKGRSCKIEQVSQVFFSFLFLEDPDGGVVAQNNSGGRGRTARIIHRAAKSGTYRIIATSQDGHRTGAISLSVRSLGGGVLPPGLPLWFAELDTDQDGQLSLEEWRKGGKAAEDFRKHDLNDDGYITPDELLRSLRAQPRRRLPNGLPMWFATLDTDQDGQISLAEWRRGGRNLDEFRKYDLNEDGFITANEVLRYLRSQPPPAKKKPRRE
jgi:Ca2+-binding EF-hand superfamily protein